MASHVHLCILYRCMTSVECGEEAQSGLANCKSVSQSQCSARRSPSFEHLQYIMGMLHSDTLVLWAGASVEGICVREVPAERDPMAPHTTCHHKPTAWHIMKSTVAVKVPLLQVDSSGQKQKLPAPAQRETRSRKKM